MLELHLPVRISNRRQAHARRTTPIIGNEICQTSAIVLSSPRHLQSLQSQPPTTHIRGCHRLRFLLLPVIAQRHRLPQVTRAPSYGILLWAMSTQNHRHQDRRLHHRE